MNIGNNIKNALIQLSFLLTTSIGVAAPNAMVRLHANPDSSLQARLESITQSRNEILIEAFYLENDSIGNLILSTLAKQKENFPKLKINLIIDGWGSSSQPIENQCFWQKRGIEWKIYNPKGLRQALDQSRTHRKIWITDTALIVGGRNLAVDHFKKTKLDWDLEIVSEMKTQLKASFFEMWYLSQNLDCSQVKKAPNIITKTEETAGFKAKVVMPNWHSAHLSWHTESQNQLHMVYTEILRLLGATQKKLLVENAYFIPPKEIFENLKVLAQKAVKMSFVLNQPLPALPWIGRTTQCLSMPYQEYLVNVNAQVFHPTPETIHGKIFAIDDSTLAIGSFNWDYRSAVWNSETLMVATEAPTLMADFNAHWETRTKMMNQIKSPSELWPKNPDFTREDLECKDRGQYFSPILKYFF